MEKTLKPGRSALGRGLAALISSPPIPVTTPANNVSSAIHSTSDISEAGTVPKMSVVDGGLTPGTQTTATSASEVRFIAITSIFPNAKQPRQEFNSTEINELSNSIQTLGVLQPVLVRPRPDSPNEYEIVAGERRWRAATQAKLQQIPVIIKQLNDLATLEIALVENIQRSNLSPLEEARAYQRLVEEFSLSQREVADRVGKDRASVANYLRLLSLPPTVLEMLQEGKISMGHAKAILTVKEPNAQIGLARKIVTENLSVRALEAIVSRIVVLDGLRKPSKERAAADSSSARSDYPEITDRLRSSLGTKVVIRHHESGRGRIEIEYFSEQELDRIVEKITE